MAKIQHLVFSGGGPTALKYMGALRYLESVGAWKYSDLKSVYGTSAGGMLAVVLCCKHDWDTSIDYFVKRPWQSAFKITPDDIFNLYSRKGIIGQTFIEIMFKPLFDAKNIPMNITLQEFYEWSGIDLHLFSLELNSFEMCDISHITHPNLPVLTAVHMTSAIPILFLPVCMDGKCYIDGGIVNNYPLAYCIKDHPEEVDDILAFKNVYADSDLYSNIEPESTVVDVIVSLCQHLLKHTNEKTNSAEIPNQILQPSAGLSAEYFSQTLESETFRQGLIDDGVDTAIKWMSIREGNKVNNG